MPVAVDLAVDLLEEREACGGQRQQRRTFDLGEQLADLLAGGAMDAGIGDGGFPVLQMPVLIGQTGELRPLSPLFWTNFTPASHLPLCLGIRGRVGNRAVP